jgi:UDP-N-acetyl-2-amino-2-deoxyglucuronate dehydrogenase
MANIIKFGIIGCGYIGKRHAEMITRNPESELIAFADIQEKENLELDSYKNAAYYNSAEELCRNHPEIEVICIATPNGLHAENALLALKFNKHIVVEKPLGLTKAECELIIFSALKHQKQVFCVMQNRYSPPSVWIKELITQKILGEIYMVQIDCYWNRDDRYYKNGGWKGTKDLDGGTLFTQFSHFIDIMYWLFGDIYNINAKFNDFSHEHTTEFEDSGFVSFDFVNGGMGCLNYSTSIWDKNLESSLKIIAQYGTIKIGGQYMNEVEYCHVKNYEMPILPKGNLANDYGNYKGSAANHNYIFENVIDVLKNRSSITTNAMEGLKVVDIIERIYKSNELKFS